MPPHLPKTARGLTQRRADALRHLHVAEWAAYIQAALGLLVYVLFAVTGGDWSAPLETLIVALVAAGLGFGVGRRQSALAAALLVLIVLGVTVLRFVSGEHLPALIIVAIFVWLYGRGFLAAREYAALREMQVEPAAPVT